MSAEFMTDQAGAWSAIKKHFDCSPPIPVETANGPGSTLTVTENLRAWLPALFESYGITSILDAACGDWTWAEHVDFSRVSYLGWDVEPDIIASNQQRFPQHTFERVNLLAAPALPPVDLILCRHMMIHLPTGYIRDLLDKCVASGSRYLLASHFPGADNSYVYDPEAAAWGPGYCERPVNLEAPPFSLSPKLSSFSETPGPYGVISQPHELALFRIG